MQKVEKLDLPINIIVVSDHGLSEIKVNSNTFIDFENFIDISDPNFNTFPSGAVINMYANDTSKIDSLYSNLKLQEETFTVFKKTELLQDWYYNENSRVGDFLFFRIMGIISLVIIKSKGMQISS
jgi:alkaline phosphatase D